MECFRLTEVELEAWVRLAALAGRQRVELVLSGMRV